MATSGTTKSAQERRDAQREALRRQRQAELKRQKSTRTLVIAVIVIVALVIAGGIGYLVYSSLKPAGPVTTPTGVAEDQTYLQLGAEPDSGAPVVELHIDFMCPVCGAFEEIHGEDIAQLVEDDQITLNLVPRRFLDAQSTTGDYSSRAANALVCVYEEDEDTAIPFLQLLFANQPAEGSAGLDNEQILQYAMEAGATEAVGDCMESRTYQPWIRDVVDPWASENGGGTPYVEINGTQLPNEEFSEPGSLKKAILAAGGSPASDGGGASDGGEG